MLDVLSGGCISRVDVGDIYLCLWIAVGEKGVYRMVFWYFVGCGHGDGTKQASFSGVYETVVPGYISNGVGSFGLESEACFALAKLIRTIRSPSVRPS